ncbi:MAG: ZIP family metal transporter [Thermofilaceae archaeon]|nr:ZIP family metal transporter [Thermofilaceae archaeon]
MGWVTEVIVKTFEEAPLLLRVLVVSSIPAVMTAIGSIPVLLGSKMSERARDTSMGFAAGVMLVASFTSLLIPAVESGGPLSATLGFLLGAALIKGFDAALPHFHWVKGMEGPHKQIKKELLVALAMVVHNIPEGMAVGAAATRNLADGLVIALAIGMQDVPEGLAVALPLVPGKGSLLAFSVGIMSGVAEALSALIPPLIVEHVEAALPFTSALAAGAMIYVVVHEVVPEIYGHEHDEPSTIGFFAGFIGMLLLDTLLSAG